MPDFPGMRRAVYQIAAQLADVLKERAIPLRDIVPEAACRKSLADRDRSAIHQYGSARHHAADAVVHRQAIVHPVSRARVNEAGEPMGPLHDSEMADPGGLRQAGRAGGVDVERSIQNRWSVILRALQRSPAGGNDLKIDPRQIVAAFAVGPASDPRIEPRQ